MIAGLLPSPVSGYVLAGGRSTRMGRDKALLALGGKSLLAHAVAKLSRVCSEYAILSGNPAHGAFGPLVHDLHPGCGPLAGIEAALAHSKREWSLILPVDVPFLPSAMLDGWVRSCLRHGKRYGTRVAMYVVDGQPQPALLMIHRDVASYVSSAVGRKEYKVLPVLTGAAEDLATKSGSEPEKIFQRWAWGRDSCFSAEANEPGGPGWRETTKAQEEASWLYFANLNTPEELAAAEWHLDALDT